MIDYPDLFHVPLLAMFCCIRDYDTIRTLRDGDPTGPTLDGRLPLCFVFHYRLDTVKLKI